jgi:hypothetical protein
MHKYEASAQPFDSPSGNIPISPYSPLQRKNIMTSTTALQQFKVGTLNIEIHPDRESAGEAAAREAAQELTHLAQSADEFGVIFATGVSQLRMLDALTSMRGLPKSTGLRQTSTCFAGSMPRSCGRSRLGCACLASEKTAT